jgi:uncharacterized membrane protein YphA (DoxX/SURF4 family)
VKHGRPSSLVALLLDFFIQVAVLDVITGIVFGIGLLAPLASHVLASIGLASYVVILLGYWPYFLIARKGYTPGRAIVGFPKP